MNNILLTGGFGFIGSHTAIELIQSGYNVIIIDNCSNSSSQSVLESIYKITGIKPIYYIMDICDKQILQNIFSNNKISCVIHFAAYKSVSESVSNPMKYYNNNITGLLTILNCMMEFNVKNIIFSSSATVYGQPKKLPITEKSKTGTLNPYGTTKLFGEYILREVSLAGDFNVILLRYFNPVGGHRSTLLGEHIGNNPSNLFPVIINSIKNNKPVIIYGSDYDTTDGTAIRDYIHVVDLAQGHVKALDFLFNNKSVTFEIFNLGTAKGYSVLDIINTFNKYLSTKVKYNFGEKRPGDASSIYCSYSKAKELLNWDPLYSLDDMVKDTLLYNNLY